MNSPRGQGSTSAEVEPSDAGVLESASYASFFVATPHPPTPHMFIPTSPSTLHLHPRDPGNGGTRIPLSMPLCSSHRTLNPHSPPSP